MLNHVRKTWPECSSQSDQSIDCGESLGNHPKSPQIRFKVLSQSLKINFWRRYTPTSGKIEGCLIINHSHLMFFFSIPWLAELSKRQCEDKTWVGNGESCQELWLYPMFPIGSRQELVAARVSQPNDTGSEVYICVFPAGILPSRGHMYMRFRQNLRWLSMYWSVHRMLESSWM